MFKHSVFGYFVPGSLIIEDDIMLASYAIHPISHGLNILLHDIAVLLINHDRPIPFFFSLFSRTLSGNMSSQLRKHGL
jgi:hypothetical protein